MTTRAASAPPVNLIAAGWHRKKPVVKPLAPQSRPSAKLLDSLRGKVEQGCPFDVARRALGVGDAVHRAWTDRGLAQHESAPDVAERADGVVVLAGSDEPEAEYVRVALQTQAGAAAELIGELWTLAKGRPGPQKLPAITMLLRGMGERAFDPRSESDVSVVATATSPTVDQADIDAMTPEEVAAMRAAARGAAAQLAASEAAVEAARRRRAAADAHGAGEDTPIAEASPEDGAADGST